MDHSQEKQLVDSCKAGDSSAFARLYDANFEKLYRFVYYRVQHRQTAEDLSSQAFLKAWDRIATFDSAKAGFSTWLCQIARNLVVDHYRKAVPTQEIESAWDLGEDAGLERDADTALLMARIRPHLSGLSPQQRQVLVMRIWDDLPYREIAQILGSSEAACKMSFSRAIAELKDKLALVIVLLSLIKPHN